MADRSVEEYSFNTSTTDTNDTTAFGYGISGNTFPGTLTTAKTKRVRFTTPIQPTDILIVEKKYSGDSYWTPMITESDSTAGSQVISTFSASSEVGFGQLRIVNSTDVDVVFRRYRTGTTDWTTALGSWRVRKVSGGAQVGYPISSANIVGRVDGNAPATGMVGQLLTETTTANGGTNTVTNNTQTNIRVLSLPAGVWDVVGYGSVVTLPTGPIRQILGLSTISATNGTQAIDRLDYPYPATLTGSFGTSTPIVRFNLSSTTTIYLVAYSSGTSGSTTFDGGSIRATRIA